MAKSKEEKCTNFCKLEILGINMSDFGHLFTWQISHGV